jgi:hypothetical protein
MKALIWLLNVVQEEGSTIQHARNGREVRLPEVPRFSMDGYCADTGNVFEFMGCFFHGCNCQPFRDLKTSGGDTLAERYERTMSKI